MKKKQTRQIKYVSKGVAFNGRKGYVIGDNVYCKDNIIEAIKAYCNDEINNCDINNYDWIDSTTGKVIDLETDQAEVKYNRVLYALQDMDDDDKVEVHNKYCDNVCMSEQKIHYIDDLDDYCRDMTASEILSNYYNIATGDRFFVADELSAYSFDYYVEIQDNLLEDIAEYCIDNNDDLGYEVIRNILED